MKALLDLLTAPERRILALLCALLAAALVFQVGFATREKRAYREGMEILSSHQTEYEQLKEKNRKKKREWGLWDQARRDVVEVESRYLYREDRNVNELRLDLRKIFNRAGIPASSELKYDYGDLEGKELRRVKVSFVFKGSYAFLKRLLYEVEKYPKFLMIERIDFLDIDTRTGKLELNVELAGYYGI